MALLLSISFAVLLTIGAASPISQGATTSSTALNNVQIFVGSSRGNNSNFSSYTLTAYNSSGYAVASSDSMYPAFGMELPSGSYLFTVIASQSSSPYYYGGQKGYPTAAPTNGYPVQSGYPLEYGYAMSQITASTTINIQTSSLSSISTSKVYVHVTYANGTAAPNVYIQGSIVGGFYFWYINPNNSVMWNQTSQDGSATITIPNVPIELSAWSYIDINLPASTVTVRTTVGGEELNVTAYWQPTYVSLVGSALIMPGVSTANAVLHVQQNPYYWLLPYGVNSASPGTMYGVAVGSSQNPTNAQTPSARLGNQVSSPLQPQGQSPSTTITVQTTSLIQGSIDSQTTQILIVSITAAIAVSILSFAFVLKTRTIGGPKLK